MRVLLTGGAGFIGRHVLNGLLARGHDVRVLDSLRPDVHAGAPPMLPAELVIADVRDADAVQKALDGVDGVCHLAAKVGLGVDVQDLPDYADSNDHGTSVLLAAMARAGVGRLALASSMAAYGEGLGLCAEHGAVRPKSRLEADLAAGHFEPLCPRCGEPVGPALVGEAVPLDPRNAYAASKVAQEHLSAAWARAVGGSSVVLRYHNVYGLGMPRDTPYAGVAALFLSELRRQRPPHVFEDGGQRRDFVHVRDIASATVVALEKHSDGVRAYNVGSATPRTVGEMAAEFARVTAGPEPVVTGQSRPGDVRHITADSARIRSELGWVPQVELADGLAELAAEA
jgi:dTDP-L-rhamnose 4-epimerase